MQIQPVPKIAECPYKKPTPQEHQYALGKGHWQYMGECFLRSCTASHPCSTVSDGQRCQYAVKWGKDTGWQSWTMRPSRPVATKKVSLRAVLPDGETSEVASFETVDDTSIVILYSPANAEGTAWIAICHLTGERKAVDQFREGYTLDGSKLTWPYTGWALVEDEKAFRAQCAACLHPKGCKEHGNGQATAYWIWKAPQYTPVEVHHKAPLKTLFTPGQPITLADLIRE